MKHYKKWNQLTASILFILGAAMVGNSFSVYANNAIVHHDRITGKYNVDRAKFRKSSGITIKRITHEDDFGTKYTDATSYNFGGRDHIFHVRDNDGITTSLGMGDVVFNNISSSGHKGTIYVDHRNDLWNPWQGVFGVNGSSGGKVTIDSNLLMRMILVQNIQMLQVIILAGEIIFFT